jgi:hypothetical protein
MLLGQIIRRILPENLTYVFLKNLNTLFNTAYLPPPTQIIVCRRMLGWNLRQLQLWLDLIHTRLDVIHTQQYI